MFKHLGPGLAKFGQSLWRSVVTVAVYTVSTQTQALMTSPADAGKFIASHWWQLTLASVVIPAIQGAKATADSAKGVGAQPPPSSP